MFPQRDLWPFTYVTVIWRIRLWESYGNTDSDWRSFQETQDITSQSKSVGQYKKWVLWPTRHWVQRVVEWIMWFFSWFSVGTWERGTRKVWDLAWMQRGDLRPSKAESKRALGKRKITPGEWCTFISLDVTIPVSVFANIHERHQLDKGNLGSASSRFCIGPAVFTLFYLYYVNSERRQRWELLENSRISFFSEDRLQKKGAVWSEALRPSS